MQTRLAPRRFAVAFACQLLIASTALGGGIPLGLVGRFQYYLVTESLHLDGDLVRFQVRGEPENMNARDYVVSYAAESAVDCRARTRIDYLTTTTFPHAPTQIQRAGTDEMKTIFDDTAQAFELETVCEIAGIPTKKSWTGPTPSQVLADGSKATALASSVSGSARSQVPLIVAEACSLLDTLERRSECLRAAAVGGHVAEPEWASVEKSFTVLEGALSAGTVSHNSYQALLLDLSKEIALFEKQAPGDQRPLLLMQS